MSGFRRRDFKRELRELIDQRRAPEMPTASNWKVVSMLNHSRFSNEGDVLALLETVVASKDIGFPLPAWAHDALAEKFRSYLADPVTLEQAILGSRRRGRHADPRTAARERRAVSQALGAVLTGEVFGLKGDKKFEYAGELLARLRAKVGVDRLRQIKRTRPIDNEAICVALEASLLSEGDNLRGEYVLGHEDLKGDGPASRGRKKT